MPYTSQPDDDERLAIQDRVSDLVPNELRHFTDWLSWLSEQPDNDPEVLAAAGEVCDFRDWLGQLTEEHRDHAEILAAVDEVRVKLDRLVRPTHVYPDRAEVLAAVDGVRVKLDWLVHTLVRDEFAAEHAPRQGHR